MNSVSKFDEILNRIKEFENIVLELKSEFLELQKKDGVQSEAESTLKFLQEYFDFDEDEFNIESTQEIIDALKSGKQILITDLYDELRLYRYTFIEKSVLRNDIITQLKDNKPFSSLSSHILTKFTNLSIENIEKIKLYDEGKIEGTKEVEYIFCEHDGIYVKKQKS